MMWATPLTNPKRVFISSTSEDLKSHRAIVERLVLDAQWMPVGMEHFPADPRPIVKLCQEAVAECDLVVLIQAFRRGWVPKSDQGGDGTTSITAWEIKAADAHDPPIPVLAFLADDSWPRDLRELDPEAESAVQAFRDNLNRNTKFFPPEDGDLPQFRALVRESLAIWRAQERPRAGAERPRSWLVALGALVIAAASVAYLFIPTVPEMYFEEGTFFQGSVTVFPEGTALNFATPTILVRDGGTERQIPIAGGTGGDDISSACPAGMAVIGFKGTRSKSMLNGLGLVCGRPQVRTGGAASALAVVSAREDQKLFGGDVDPPPDRIEGSCVDDGFVTGVEVESRTVMGPGTDGKLAPLGPYITRVSATCSRVEVSSTGATLPRVTAHHVFSLGVEDRPRMLTSYTCPPGAVVVGLRGRASAYIDALAFACGKVVTGVARRWPFNTNAGE